MKNFISSSLTIFFILVLCSCNSIQATSYMETSNDKQLALEVLTDFLQYLHNGNYEKAAQLYGGTYETMIDHNPSVDPNEHATLLKNACTINGMQCLQVKSVSLYKKLSTTEFVFSVDFLNADDTLFFLGPCCGDNATDFSPRSVFNFTVIKVAKNRFFVMDMPPYVP